MPPRRAAYLAEALAHEVGSGVEALLAAMVANDDQVRAGPSAENFLHHGLGAGSAGRVKMGRALEPPLGERTSTRRTGPVLEQPGELGRGRFAISSSCWLAGLDVLDDFLHVQRVAGARALRGVSPAERRKPGSRQIWYLRNKARCAPGKSSRTGFMSALLSMEGFIRRKNFWMISARTFQRLTSSACCKNRNWRGPWISTAEPFHQRLVAVECDAECHTALVGPPSRRRGVGMFAQQYETHHAGVVLFRGPRRRMGA